MVFFEDECHLLWGDICGYVWAAAFGGKLPPETCLGNTKERVEIPVINERQRQTYFGALNYYTQEFLVKPYKKGDSKETIAFVEYLLAQFPKRRIALIWDGASYHRSAEFQAYLNCVNQGLNENEWKVTCIRERSKCSSTKSCRRYLVIC